MLRAIVRQLSSCHALVFYAVIIALGAASYKVAIRPSSALFQWPAIAQQTSAPPAPIVAPDIRTHFVSTRQDIATHAASLVELSDGTIRSFWFVGSREGAKDVEIRSAVFNPAKNLWGPEHRIANREDTQRSLLRYVKKLGNPVAQRAPDGTLWLFYVTVSLGGWGGSSITAITSKDDGASWSPARRLITSPFINISTLVKSAPFAYDDGTIGLPVYHEFIGKFSELLRLSNTGEVIDKQRLSSGKFALQPLMLIKDPQHAMVLMRHSGAQPKRVIVTTTDDAGQHWRLPTKSALANPDAAISGLVLSGGRLLLALNNIEEGRDALSLVVSADNGVTWKTLHTLEDMRGQSSDPAHYMKAVGALSKATDANIIDETGYANSVRKNKCNVQRCSYEFSYPYLIQTANGDFHLAYTWNRSFIKHVQFSQGWLKQRMEKVGDAELH